MLSDDDANTYATHYTTFGHSWWQLSIVPSAAKQFLGTDIYGDSLANYLGIAGYYGNGSAQCSLSCPGHVHLGPQPIQGSNPIAYYNGTASYWWGISFDDLAGALSYVDNLYNVPGTYYATSNNCVTQAVNVGWEAYVPLNYYGFMPCGLGNYLNTLSGSVAQFAGKKHRKLGMS